MVENIHKAGQPTSTVQTKPGIQHHKMHPGKNTETCKEKIEFSEGLCCPAPAVQEYADYCVSNNQAKDPTRNYRSVPGAFMFTNILMRYSIIKNTGILSSMQSRKALPRVYAQERDRKFRVLGRQSHQYACCVRC